VPMAYELRDLLGRAAEITVVAESDWFHFTPSNPWVAVKWRTPENIKVHLPGVFSKLGIGFTSAGAKRIDASGNSVHLRDGTSLSYDYLVIATGPRLAFDEIEGLGPNAHSASICHVDHAAATSDRWEAFCKDPGPIVVGATQGTSCFGPAYEYALTAVAVCASAGFATRSPLPS
jgi:sulfide:quinone oxidoreductase